MRGQGELDLPLGMEEISPFEVARLTKEVTKLHINPTDSVVDSYLLLARSINGHSGHTVMVWSHFEYTRPIDGSDRKRPDELEMSMQGWAIAFGRLTDDRLVFDINGDSGQCYLPTDGHLVYVMAQSTINSDLTTKAVIGQHDGIPLTSRRVNLPLGGVLDKANHQLMVDGKQPAYNRATTYRSLPVEMAVAVSGDDFDPNKAPGIAVGAEEIKQTLDALDMNPFRVVATGAIPQADLDMQMLGLAQRFGIRNPLRDYASEI